jgi:hypothetical protein
MNSIFFQSFFLNQDFKAVLICIFILYGCNTIASVPDKGQIKVREFKTYREFKFHHSRILFNKVNKTLVYEKNKSQIVFNNQNDRVYSFSKYGKNAKHMVFYKVDKFNKKLIGYVSKERKKYFKTSDDICSFQEMSSKLKSSDVFDIVDQFNASALLDNQSCGQVDSEEVKELETNIKDLVDEKSSSLARCFDSAEAQKFFNQDSFLKNSASEIFFRYLGLINGISDTEKPIKIVCEERSKSDDNVIASFDEMSNPFKISFAIKNRRFKMNLAEAGQVLNHEVFHYGAQQLPVGTDLTCLDENFAILFEKVCRSGESNFKMERVERSQDIFSECLKNKKWRITKNSSIIAGYEPGKGNECLESCMFGEIANQVASARTDQQKVTESLQKVVGPLAFKDVPNSDIEALAANLQSTTGQKISDLQDGEFHTIQATPQVRASLDRVESAFSQTADSVGVALAESFRSVNAAAAVIVGNKAQAASAPAQASAGKVNYGPYTATEILADTYMPSSKTDQVFSNPKLATMNYDQKEEYYRSLGAGSTSTTASSARLATGSTMGSGREAGSVSSNQGFAADEGAAQIQNVQGARAGSGVAVVPARNGGAGVAGALPVKNSRTPASIPAAGLTAPAAAVVEQPDSGSGKIAGGGAAASVANARLDNVALQTLTAFSSIKGSQYVNIRKNYNDPRFFQNANNRGIRIYTDKAPKWTSSAKPERCFVDDGSSLTKTVCKDEK